MQCLYIAALPFRVLQRSIIDRRERESSCGRRASQKFTSEIDVDPGSEHLISYHVRLGHIHTISIGGLGLTMVACNMQCVYPSLRVSTTFHSSSQAPRTPCPLEVRAKCKSLRLDAGGSKAGLSQRINAYVPAWRGTGGFGLVWHQLFDIPLHAARRAMAAACRCPQDIPPGTN